MSEKPKIKSLWGDLPIAENIRTPYIILKEQASILTEVTDGLLVGNVFKKTAEYSSRYNFQCTLEIKVPAINNYSISIVDILYDPNIYPLLIRSDVTDIYAEEEYNYEKCDTEEQVNLILSKILSSSEVKRIISGLLNEVRSDKTEKVDEQPF